MIQEINTRRRFLRSTSFNVINQVILLAGNLLVTPVFLRYLGADGYGLWALVLAMSGTAGGMDMGISVGLLRAVPEHVASEDYFHLASITGAVIIFYAAFSLVTLLAAFIFAPLILDIINFGDVQRDVVWKMIIAAAVILSISSMANISRAMLQGLNRFDMAALLSVSTFIVFALSSVASLFLGYGLFGLVGSMVIMFALQFIGGAILARKICPSLSVSIRGAFSRSVWSYLFRFGSRIQVSYLTDIFKTQVPKLMAGAFFGPAAAGMYDLGNRIANAGWTLPAALLPAVVPTASEAHSRGDARQIRNLYVKGTRWLVTLALPLGAALALFSYRIFDLWLGPGYESAAFVLLCLSLGNVLHLTTGVGTSIGRGIALPGFEARYQVLTLFLYIVLGYSLMHSLGFEGIPLGVACASATGALYFLWLFAKAMDISLRSFMISVYKTPLAAVSASLITTVLAMPVLGTRIANVYLLAVMTLIFSLTYLLTTFAVISRSERQSFFRLISSARAVMRLGEE
ncbi:MAG: oligosaccharide flippase family protein [Actinobacteria bacterium]|nr:oligosaccharide flippase family protein [Actinomycetota bacterium]